jgi:hypothetical protein
MGVARDDDLGGGPLQAKYLGVGSGRDDWLPSMVTACRNSLSKSVA